MLQGSKPSRFDSLIDIFIQVVQDIFNIFDCFIDLKLFLGDIIVSALSKLRSFI